MMVSVSPLFNVSDDTLIARLVTVGVVSVGAVGAVGVVGAVGDGAPPQVAVTKAIISIVEKRIRT